MKRSSFSGVLCVAAALTFVGLGAVQALAQMPTPGRPGVTAAPQGQQAFATPQAAADALLDAVRRADTALMQKVLGTRYRDVISVDPDDVDTLRVKFLEAYDKNHKLNMDGDAKATLEVGSEGWTFPIPLAKRADGWRFDMVAGAEEVGNRQIGANELAVVQVLLAVVDAQQDYIDADPMKAGVPQYARRLLSTPGKKDGLYWAHKDGEPESPMGELVAQAQADGASKADGYFGYHYRMLYAQGPNAPGGAYDYLVHDKMIGGFAVVAWPVRYGETGIMTFIVNQDGIVHEKDLGPKTPAAAARIKAFDPDKTWKKSDTAP